MGKRSRKGWKRSTYSARRNRVRILSLGQEGQLIGTSRPGLMKVLVGTSLIDVAESDLKLLSDDDTRDPGAVAAPVRTGKGARLGKFRQGPMFSTTLDLHGLTVRDALEMVARKLNRALLAEADSIRIIQPRDVKKLDRALRDFLATLKYVESVETDEDNPDVTWVRLKSSQRLEDPTPVPPTA